MAWHLFSSLIPQRKNGLFKKAYELGVLCSVDVAVIIFGAYPRSCHNMKLPLTHLSIRLFIITEERPGHHVKLYQYCSGNIDEIAQRHSRVCILCYQRLLYSQFV